MGPGAALAQAQGWAASTGARGGWGHAAAAPASPHGLLGCPSVLKSVYFKGYKVLGCCRVTGALAEPLIKVCCGCRRGEEEGGWQQPGTILPPHTPLDLAPMHREPSVRCRGRPAVRPHCPAAARAGRGDRHLLVAAGGFFVRRPAHARAGSSSPRASPFPSRRGT